MSVPPRSERIADLVKLTHQFFRVSHAGDIRGAQSLKEDIETGLEDLSMDEDYAYHLGVVALLTQSTSQVLDRELIMECNSNQLPIKLKALKEQFPMLEMMAEETDRHFKAGRQTINDGQDHADKDQRISYHIHCGPSSPGVH